MANTNPLGTRYQFASREDRLASDIIAGIETVRRISDGTYQELVSLLAVARLTSNPARIRTSPLPQLQATWALLQGFIDNANNNKSIQLPSSASPVMHADINGSAATYASAVPFSLERPDGVVQKCIVAINAQPDVVVGTWLPANQTGAVSNAAVMWLTPTTVVGFNVTKLNNSTAIIRILSDTAADNRIYTVTLSAAGVISSTLLVTLAATALVGDTAGVSRDYTDGNVFWCTTQDAAGACRIHRIQLSAPVATDYQRITGMTAHATQGKEVVVFAYGDAWSFIGRITGNGNLYHVTGTLAEGGGIPAAIAINAAVVTVALVTQNAIATGLTNALVSAPLPSPTGGSPYQFRLCLHPSVIATDGMAVITIDKTKSTAALQTTFDYTKPSLVNITAAGTSNGIARDVIPNADFSTIMAVEDATANAAAVYDMATGAQIQVLDTGPWLTTVLHSSDCFVGKPLALVTFAGGTYMFEVGL